jgi:hypothetical protein
MKPIYCHWLIQLHSAQFSKPLFPTGLKINNYFGRKTDIITNLTPPSIGLSYTFGTGTFGRDRMNCTRQVKNWATYLLHFDHSDGTGQRAGGGGNGVRARVPHELVDVELERVKPLAHNLQRNNWMKHTYITNRVGPLPSISGDRGGEGARDARSRCARIHRNKPTL